MSDNKLKIRINLQQPQSSEFSSQNDPEASSSQTEPEYWNALEKQPFDWRKITLAAIVLIMFLGTVGYMSLNIFETHPRADTSETNPESGILENYSSRFNTFDDVPSVTSPENTSPETSASEQFETKQTETTYSTTNKKQNHLADASNAPFPKTKPARTDKITAPSPPKPGNKPTALTANSETDALQAAHEKKSIISTPATDATAPAADHPGVIRAQLTHQIHHREPVDEVHRITLDNKSNKAIYFFVELHDFENKTVIVDWYFEDRLITQTKLHINHKQWRTNAKKLLRKRDAGNWQVRLLDQTDKVLAERRFVVE